MEYKKSEGNKIIERLDMLEWGMSKILTHVTPRDQCAETPINGSPTFYELLKEMADTHNRKSHDYASNHNPFGNYEFAGLVSSLFSHSPNDAGFAGRLAEKMYRLSALEGGQKQPLNESIDDTERDIAVIATLWMASRKDKRMIISQSQPMNEGQDQEKIRSR